MKIRYYGHVGQQTGYGRAAEQTCLALLEVGAELEIRSLARLDFLSFSPDAGNMPLIQHLRTDDQLTAPDVVIVHTLPLDCPRVIELAANTLPVGVECVAYTTWEFHTPPETVRNALSTFDEVWVPSYASGMLTSAPCRVIPHAFDHRTMELRRRRVVLEGEQPYRFLYVGAWNARKNVPGLIAAYVAAFEKHENVELLIHSPGVPTEIYISSVFATGIRPDELPRIVCHNTYASYDQMLELYRSVDCYVTASRGEAWNLPLFDAMTCGCHLIVPANHGSADYIQHATGSDTVRGFRQFGTNDVIANRDESGQMSFQTRGAQGLTSRVTWDDPDLVQLSNWMRQRYQARKSQNYNQPYAFAEYGYEAIGKQMLTALTTLKEMA